MMISAANPRISRNRGLHVRPVRMGDLDAVLALVANAGSGLTNLQPDRAAMSERIAATQRALTDPQARLDGDVIMLVGEHGDAIVGTAMIFARVGAQWPFYSYRITRQAKYSQGVGRLTEQKLLNLVNDLDGETEVGGLFVDPTRRGQSLGRIMSRSRYLFIARHRSWFANRVIAELRGYQTADGRSPVWEAIGRHFYEMDFHEADATGSLHGGQFIADLGPRYPIYLSLLPDDARAAFGQPHDDGRPAREMLLSEGFRNEGYVDIFDGGPTLIADIDAIKTVRQADNLIVTGIAELSDGEAVLACTGNGQAFRCATGKIKPGLEGATITPTLAAAIDIGIGEGFCYAPA